MSSSRHEAPPPTSFSSLSSLQFPIASQSLSHTTRVLHQSSQSTHNRLASICQDATFVTHIGYSLGLPIIANERCGGWYVPPESRAGSAYFKSTDGHYGEWAFSKRRLNLQLLEIIGKNQGCASYTLIGKRCIIADSTRRGKSMPDALAKTVPIWCVVLNRLLFEDNKAGYKLYFPSGVVGPSERVQIIAKLGSFVADAKALQLNIASLRNMLSKPLRPFWVTPETIDSELPSESSSLEFYPVVCCTASRRATGIEGFDDNYIQGAGDDSESWSHGLTSPVFWKHKRQLLNASEHDIGVLIQELMLMEKKIDQDKKIYSILPPSERLYVARLVAATRLENYDGAVICDDKPEEGASQAEREDLLSLKCGPGKLGSRALRAELSRVPPFIMAIISRTPSPKILFSCATGTDLSIGVALVVLCLFFNDDCQSYFSKPATNSGSSFCMAKMVTIGNEMALMSQKANGDRVDTPISNGTTIAAIDKSFIRRRLAWITNAKPDSNPSRSTLQAVNSFLMERPV